jgi:hypothetical protein
MSDTTHPGPSLPSSLNEVRGRFPSDAAMQDAVSRLTLAGFDRAALSVPGVAQTPGVHTPEQGATDPNTDVDQRQLRTLSSSTSGVAAAMVGAGLVVATGGAAALAAAAAAGAGLAGAGATYAAMGDVTNHSEREAAAASGQLMLSVRVTAPDEAHSAEQVMRAAGASAVETVQRAA